MVPTARATRASNDHARLLLVPALAVVVSAQTPTPDAPRSFEVAAVKENKSGQPFIRTADLKDVSTQRCRSPRTAAKHTERPAAMRYARFLGNMSGGGFPMSQLAQSP